MHIGLIGGIGPAATVAYYTGLVQAFKAAGRPLHLTISHADMAVLSANAASDNRSEQEEIFAKHLHQLNAAGCDIAVITALTGHFCLDETRALSPLALLDGIDVIDRYCAKHDIQSLGLLGSPAVLKTQLFGKITAARTLVPSKNTQAVGAAYMEMAATGHCSDATREMFFSAGQEMCETQGAQAVLLAGTDLGLAFNGYTPGYTVIDALDLHISALVELSG